MRPSRMIRELIGKQKRPMYVLRTDRVVTRAEAADVRAEFMWRLARREPIALAGWDVKEL